MPPKRTAASLANSILARPSPHNSSVTLFTLPPSKTEPEEEAKHQWSSDSPRRSKRVKTSQTSHSPIPDLEDDLGSKSWIDDSPPPKPKVTRLKTASATPSPRKAKQPLVIPHSSPPRWRETYNIIKDMRARLEAPVDTMGCQMAQVAESDPKNRRYATLVSLMLSSQTTDLVVHAAIQKLRAALGGSISLQGMLDVNEKVLEGAICKVGFWPKKTKYLKETAQMLRDNFDSDVPKTEAELCTLKGVGPKMAILALQFAWDINIGIGVDVHVHRITNHLGWHKTETPQQTRQCLESWLPKEYHREINHLLVGFGQVLCLPVAPRCDECPINAAGLCPKIGVKKAKGKARAPLVLRDNVKEEDGGPMVEIEVETVKEEVKEERK